MKLLLLLKLSRYLMKTQAWVTLIVVGCWVTGEPTQSCSSITCWALLSKSIKRPEKLNVMDSTHEQVCYARTHIHHTHQRPNDLILTVHQEWQTQPHKKSLKGKPLWHSTKSTSFEKGTEIKCKMTIVQHFWQHVQEWRDTFLKKDCHGAL